MGDKSRIAWTDASWNPITGCSKVSPGCANCYAETMAKRLQAMGSPRYKAGFTPTFHPEALAEPLRWQTPRRIFVCSMGDLFHEKITDEQIAAVFGVMAAAPRHTFQVLSKRPERMRAWFEWVASRKWKAPHSDVRVTPHPWYVVSFEAAVYPLPKLPSLQPPYPWPLPNVWLGVTAEDQERADERIPFLLETPAAKRFVSVEPCIGPVDLRHIKPWHPAHGPDGADALAGGSWGHEFVKRLSPGSPGYCNHSDAPRLDWVIVGGESGPAFRPLDLYWVRSIRDQCAGAGVPFFLKQLAGVRPEHLPALDGKQWLEFPR